MSKSRRDLVAPERIAHGPWWLGSPQRVSDRRLSRTHGREPGCFAVLVARCPASVPNTPSPSRRRRADRSRKTRHPSSGWRARRGTKKGRAVYSRRKAIVEPVFGQIGTVQDGRRVLIRGKPAARAQWRLECAIHNLLKLYRAGGLTLLNTN